VEPRSESAKLGYFPAVDGLRAVAILSVLLFHLRPGYLRGGFVGVDVFFVISGFVVTASLAHLRFSRLRDLLAYFYARRIVRILPALVVVLAATTLASILFIPPRGLLESRSTGVAAFFGLSNVLLALDRENYFDPGADLNPFLHSWTLGVEEQFYLIFPFFFYFYQRALAAPSDNRRAIATIALATLLSLAACAWLTWIDWRYAFYLMPARFWELGTGMLLCLTINRWRPRIAAARPSAVLLGSAASALVLGAAFLIPGGRWFPFPLALLPAAATAGLIVLVCSRPDSLAARALSRRPVVFIGKISYSLYLWHWPVFVLFRWTVGLDGKAEALAATALALLAAIASYRLVEQPIRRSGRIRLRPRRIVIAAGAAAMLAGAGTAVLAFRSARQLSLVADEARWWGASRPGACPPAMEVASFGGGKRRSWRPSCPGDGAGRLFAAGDSHVNSYMKLFGRHAAEAGVPVTSYWSPTCEFPSLSAPMASRPQCAAYYREVVDELARTLRPGDVLFMPSLRLPRFSERRSANPGAAQRAEAYGEARRLLSRLAGTGAILVLEAPKPIFRSPLYRCVDWFNRGNPACAGGFHMPQGQLASLRAAPLEAMRRLARDVPNVSLWDPFPILCPADPCDALRAGQPLFQDEDHLSGHANDLLYPHFRRFLEAQRRAARPPSVP